MPSLDNYITDNAQKIGKHSDIWFSLIWLNNKFKNKGIICSLSLSIIGCVHSYEN